MALRVRHHVLMIHPHKNFRHSKIECMAYSLIGANYNTRK
jgi:hypothetical protein